MKQEYIGVILPDGIYQVLLKGQNQINVSAYQAAGEHYHLIPFFMRLRSIKPGVDQVKGFVKTEGKYKLKTIPIPKVIYTRSFLSKRQIHFLEKRNIQFYNKKGIGHNKWNMHQIISENPELQAFLPKTVKGTIENLRIMMNQHNHLILKPATGSLGGGIMKLSKDNFGTWVLNYPLARKQWSQVNFKDEIPPYITEIFSKKQYIIQERIELATYNERPFDLRVVVQRNHTGNWVLAGILCKVSPLKEQFVTNISQGGRSLSFDSVLKGHPSLSYSQVYDDISQLTLKLAIHLEKYTEHIADIAFDIALNKEGHPYFIESNFRGRYGNMRYKGKRYEEWKAKHFNPIGYGRFLIDRIGKQHGAS